MQAFLFAEAQHAGGHIDTSDGFATVHKTSSRYPRAVVLAGNQQRCDRLSGSVLGKLLKKGSMRLKKQAGSRWLDTSSGSFQKIILLGYSLLLFVN